MQIIQTANDRLVVRLVREKAFEEEEKAKFLKEFTKRLGDGFHIELEYARDIPREPNGKFRAIVSLVNQR